MYLKTPSKVEAVLASCTQRASAMTHTLCDLGDGDMGAGIIALWQGGRSSGFVQGITVTSLAFALGFGAYQIVKNKLEDRRVRKMLADINHQEYQNTAIEGGN